MTDFLSKIVKILTRAKSTSNPKILRRNIFTTKLKQCLNTRHIIFLCVGNMVGTGLYKLTGEVIRDITGPTVILCFILAGLAAFLSALCYAELEGRLPVAGSAYSFTYVVVGEWVAFTVGWDMLLENVIGGAALAKSWSDSFDSLLDYRIRNVTLKYIGPIKDLTGSGVFSNPNGPDILAAVIVGLVSLLICTGAERSANFISCFAIVNLLIIGVIIGYGMSLSDLTLWTKCTERCFNKTCTSLQAFMPYGPVSVITGSTRIYFSYIGFNWVATAGEEAKTPEKSLPYGTMIGMVLVIVVYVLMSTTLTLLVPYCETSPTSAFSWAFMANGRNNRLLFVVVSIGSLCAMTTVLFGTLFALPRTIYAMSTDGLIFGLFKKLNTETQTPVWGVLVFGLIASLLALCFNLETLATTTTLGTLIDFSLIACCVIMLRYRDDSAKIGAIYKTNVDKIEVPGKLKKKYLFLEPVANKLPSRAVSYIVLIMIPCLFGVAVTVSMTEMKTWWSVLILVILCICSMSCILFIIAHRQSDAQLHFKVPFVPILPAASLLLNLMLIVHTTYANNWFNFYRYIVWFLIGMVIYFGYGVRHSKEKCIPPMGGDTFSADTSPKNSSTTCSNQPQDINYRNISTISENSGVNSSPDVNTVARSEFRTVSNDSHISNISNTIKNGYIKFVNHIFTKWETS